MKTTISLLTLAALAAGNAYGQTTSVFDDGSSAGAAGLALEGESSTTYEQSGITLSASTAFGVFNLTDTGFGPNDEGSGDDSDFFDGSESMVFSFDTDGIFNSIDFASLGGATQDSETATITFAGTGGGSTILNLRDSGTSDISVSGNDVFNNIGYSFEAGEQITLAITAGNGWTLENFTVTAVAESGTFALLAGLLGLTAVMLRRRK